MKTLFTALSLFFLMTSFSQSYINENETCLFSFETNSGKMLMIAKDANNRYLKYRFGSADSVELEYPKYKKNSWKQFTYSYYYRADVADKPGLEQNYLYFDYENIRYVVYWTYSAEQEHTECGIKIMNQTNKSVKVIIGNAKTVKGSLNAAFRENEMVIEGEELFD